MRLWYDSLDVNIPDVNIPRLSILPYFVPLGEEASYRNLEGKQPCPGDPWTFQLAVTYLVAVTHVRRCRCKTGTFDEQDLWYGYFCKQFQIPCCLTILKDSKSEQNDRSRFSRVSYSLHLTNPCSLTDRLARAHQILWPPGMRKSKRRSWFF